MTGQSEHRCPHSVTYVAGHRCRHLRGALAGSNYSCHAHPTARGKALGIWGDFTGVAAAAGPVVGGAGWGIAIAVPTVPTAVMRSVGPAKVGIASGISHTFRNIGAVFGVAIAAAIFASRPLSTLCALGVIAGPSSGAGKLADQAQTVQGCGRSWRGTGRHRTGKPDGMS
jgi:hypothetical protein